MRLAKIAVVALLVIAVAGLSAWVFLLLDRPTVTRYTGEVVQLTSDRDAVVVETNDGHQITGILAISGQSQPLREGDQVTVKVISDPNVIYVVEVE